jgi:hypothetical protein
MPPSIALAFDQGIISGNNIQWGSVGPNGIFFFSLANNQSTKPLQYYNTIYANSNQFTTPEMQTWLQM